MKRFFIPSVAIISLVVIIFSCKSTNKILSETGANKHEASNIIIGFNQNWSFLPPLNSPVFISNIKKLKPEMIRFPGGTIAHHWDWRTGKFDKPREKDFVHPIGDVKQLVDSVPVKIIFDLDIVNGTVDDQIAMLDSVHSLGVPIEYIELGNELYSRIHGYETEFPDGNAYADTVNAWVPKLRNAYPKAKIAALHIGKTSDLPRQKTWNEQVVKRVKDIDAFTYHIYISEGQDFEKRKAIFFGAYFNPDKKPLWITEYGNLNEATKEDYLVELSKLVEFVESLPGVTIALNHAMVSVGVNRSKIERSTLGNTFTKEGEMFVERAKKRN